LGASAQQLAPVTIDYSEGAIIGSKNRKLLPHFFFTGGYKLPINEDFAIVPSFMLKKVDPLPIQGEANVKALYKNFIWAGGTYRFKYGFAALAGISIMSNIDVTYSYDYSTTSLNKVSNGTHEVQFGFLLKTKYSNTKCPKNIW
jgi:type IX secretion system PorP/SprF family membrane protein